MKQIIFLIAILLFPLDSWSAAFTSKATGNWSSSGQTTWNEVGVPGTGDTVTIANGHTVTQDGNVTVGATVVSGRLTMATGVTLTMEGSLTIGNGTSQDGQLDFGAGSTLALGANHLILGNCWLRSNATSGSWAKITGTGNIQTHGTVTGPKQDIVLSYVSFQNTGTILFAHKPAGTGAAGVTNQIDMQHNAFVSTGTITSGVAGTGDTDMLRRWLYNDFVTTGAILFTGQAGTPTSETSLKFNTFSATSSTNIRINNIHGWTIEGNVFRNYTYGVASSATSGGHTWTGNVWIATAITGGTNTVIINETYSALTFQDNYFYADYLNPHQFGMTGSGGSGTVQFLRNVFEETAATDEGNVLQPNTLAFLAEKNLLIGQGVLGTRVTAVTGAGATFKQNTICVTDDESGVYGRLWLFESTGNYVGDLKLTSNLMYPKSTVTLSGTEYFATNNTSTIPITITYGDYNSYPAGLTANYRQLTVTSTGHDINANPQWVDDLRNLGTWGQTVHGTDGSDSAAITKLLAVNGYNSTSKTQSDSPSGVDIFGTTSSLVDWVRAGFVPTNTALSSAGEGGIYIGAIEPATSGLTGSGLLMGF